MNANTEAQLLADKIRDFRNRCTDADRLLAEHAELYGEKNHPAVEKLADAEEEITRLGNRLEASEAKRADLIRVLKNALNDNR